MLWWDLRPNESQLLRCPMFCEGAWREVPGAAPEPVAAGMEPGPGCTLGTAPGLCRKTGSQGASHCPTARSQGCKGSTLSSRGCGTSHSPQWMAQAFMGPSSGATQCLPAARAETNCRSQVASKIPTISWRSTMPKPCHFRAGPSSLLIPKSAAGAKLPWSLSQLQARAGLPRGECPHPLLGTRG